MAKCMNSFCKRELPAHKIHRGLCHSCYQLIRIEIKRGNITWDEVLKAGKCLPVKSAQKGDSRIWKWLNK